MPAQQRHQARGDGLDGSQRVVDLVGQHSDDPLPSLPLFLAERAREVGEHEELEWLPLLADDPTPELPSPRSAGVGQLQRAGSDTAQGLVEPQLFGGPTDDPLGRLTEQALAGTVEQAQFSFLVEREDRNVDLLQHLAQDLSCLDRTQVVARGAPPPAH